MKKLVILLFIPVYFFALVVPFLPLISYTLNKEFISKNLCENKEKPKMHCKGKCYLTKKIKEQAEQEKQTPSNLKMIEELVLFCSENSIAFSAKTFPIVSEYHSNDLVKSYTSPLAGIFQPPQ